VAAWKLPWHYFCLFRLVDRQKNAKGEQVFVVVGRSQKVKHAQSGSMQMIMRTCKSYHAGREFYVRARIIDTPS